MGKDKIIPLIIRRKKTKEFLGEWRIKSGINKTGYGKPTKENLEKHVNHFNQSCINGTNKHLGINYTWNFAVEIYSQLTGKILAEYNPPMFQCY